MLSPRCVQLLGIAVASCIACAGKSRDEQPPIPTTEVVVVGESTRWHSGERLPPSWATGGKLSLAGARGETLGIQVFHPPGAATLRIDGAKVRGFAVERVTVKHASTAMYGGSRGEGEYPDELRPVDAPTTDPAYFEIAIPRDASPGVHTGELAVGDRKIAVALEVAPVTLTLPLRVWAYYDARELGWASGVAEQPAKPVAGPPTKADLGCIQTFRDYGVLLSPDLTVDEYTARKSLLAGFSYVPALLPDDVAKVPDAVRAWIAATAGTGQTPFAIPVDEPRGAEARKRVRAIGEAVRGAGGGRAFLMAVTDQPRDEYGDAIDLYILHTPKQDDRFRRWVYNGRPPRAGAMVLDAETPGMRTWGLISARYKLDVWYVWDALYWHDRHNRKGTPLPGRALDRSDAISFDDGDDHGNLDGVLAYPDPAGCRPSLRLAALRRGFSDRALYELAAACKPAEADKVLSDLIPRALGEAGDTAAWPADEAVWEAARRKLLALAACK